MNFREKYDKLFIEKTLLLQEKKAKRKKLIKIKKQIKTCTIAHSLLIEVSEVIQQRFKKRVEVLITDAIQSVYDYPYIFKLLFERKRNAIEVRPIIKKGEKELIPKDDMGGGILDIIAIGFQIILWYLQNPKTRPILFLDEPLKFLGSYSRKAGFMLKYLSKYFGIQIIMTSHDKQLTEFYDKIYRINFDGVESIATRQIQRR